MTRILSIIIFHAFIYFSTDFWWANAGIAVLFGFLYHSSVKWWLQTLTVAALVLVHSTFINFSNESILANQLIEVFGLTGGWLLIPISTLVISLGVFLGQWAGRSFRTHFRPLDQR